MNIKPLKQCWQKRKHRSIRLEGEEKRKKKKHVLKAGIIYDSFQGFFFTTQSRKIFYVVTKAGIIHDSFCFFIFFSYNPE